MIVLHLALLLERLGAEPAGDTGLQRQLVETFVTDLDDAMRELGIGDLAVPKRVKRAAGGLYERAARYGEPLVACDPAKLAEIIAETVFAARDPTSLDSPCRLAEYMIACRTALRGQDIHQLSTGRVAFAPLPGG